MYDMQEFSTSEDLVSSMFDIGTHETTHPVISDHHRWENFELTEALESSECKERKLFRNIHGSFSIVRFREKLRIVEPDIVDSTVFSSVDTELILESRTNHSYISLINKTILC